MGERTLREGLRRLMGLESPTDPDPAERPPSEFVLPKVPLSLRVDDQMAEGRYREAVMLAFTGALRESLALCQVEPTEAMTYPEVIELLSRTAPAGLTTALRRLYEHYRPLRYGPPVRLDYGEQSTEVRELVKEVGSLRPAYEPVSGPARSAAGSWSDRPGEG